MTHTVFVVNPASANGATGRHWPEIAKRAADHGLTGDALLTTKAGEGAELAEKAVADGARLIVVVGGDGTLNEVVNGIVRAKAEVEVGLVPRGTGDDFARTFSLPDDLDAALEVAARGKVRSVDVGRARFRGWDGSDAERYFANFAGAGISGAIAARGAETSRRLGARLAYFWATVAVFARWKSVETKVWADDDERAGQMFEIFVANGAYAAGGMFVAPDAAPDDGLFDTVLIGDFSKAEFVVTFPKIYKGRHIGHPKIEVLRARSVAVDAVEPLPIVLDGEQPGTTPATFEVVPHALRLRVR